MKITLKYEEDDSPSLVLKLTLPQKYVNGPTKDVVKLFTDHYNKKHTDNLLDPDALHLKPVGGEHLDGAKRVKDCLAHGDECYLLGSNGATSLPAKRAAAVATAPVNTSPEVSAGPKVPKNEKGKLRCKNFGCQQYFDPDAPPQKCVSHKAPPVFHETAKWWSCCPDHKAYDFDDFMRIPGCKTGFCTNEEGAHGGKRTLGGTDLRGDSAPIRLDANAPKDPRHKLKELMSGLVAIGVDGALFEKVWQKLASQTDDMEKVCEQFRLVLTGVLNQSDS